jgi:hypothetical protein
MTVTGANQNIFNEFVNMEVSFSTSSNSDAGRYTVEIYGTTSAPTTNAVTLTFYVDVLPSCFLDDTVIL